MSNRKLDYSKANMHDGRFYDPHPNPLGKRKKSKPEDWQIKNSQKRRPFINQKAFIDFMRNPRNTDHQKSRKCKYIIKKFLVNKFKLNLILETNGIKYRYAITRKKKKA